MRDQKPPYTVKIFIAFFIYMAAGLCPQTALTQALSPAQAAEKARQKSQGKVLKVKPYNQKTGGYMVRILTKQGQVRELFIQGSNNKK